MAKEMNLRDCDRRAMLREILNMRCDVDMYEALLVRYEEKIKRLEEAVKIGGKANDKFKESRLKFAELADYCDEAIARLKSEMKRYRKRLEDSLCLAFDEKVAMWLVSYAYGENGDLKFPDYAKKSGLTTREAFIAVHWWNEQMRQKPRK